MGYQPPTEWTQWVEWLAAGLHGSNRWRLALVISGIVFARGRRTVSSWLRAAGIRSQYAGYYYFLQPLGRKTFELSQRLFSLLLQTLPLGDTLRLAVDDSPTRRYGPYVEGAGIHHNPTPGPADQKFVYGHVWLTICLVVRHPLWNTIGLPLVGLLYVRAKDVASITRVRWPFRTKLQLAVDRLLPLIELAKAAGKTVSIVADGAFANAPFLKPLRAAGATIVSRLRKNARLFDLPKPDKRPRRGRPRKYGRRRMHLAPRAASRGGWQAVECFIYGRAVTKRVKTFLATYAPAGGVIRVLIVKEERGPQYFFSTNPEATPREILETFADRAAIEQDFHDVKEIWGAGQQQVRNVWSNIAAFNLNLWVHTLVECWAWNKPADEIRDRSESPWDDPERRPSHADRRKALRRATLQNEYSELSPAQRCSSKIRGLYQRLLQLAA